jgi:YD repeat-containing protein
VLLGRCRDCNRLRSLDSVQSYSRVDSRSDPLTVTDPRGNVTSFTYDDNRARSPHHTASTVVPTTSATCTPFGKTATTTDANGNITRCVV